MTRLTPSISFLFEYFILIISVHPQTPRPGASPDQSRFYQAEQVEG